VTRWIVRLAPNFEGWLLLLPELAQEAVLAAIEVFEEYGPWVEPSPTGLPVTSSSYNRISLLGGTLTIGYRLDPLEDVVVLVHGHAADDGHGRQVQFAQLLGSSLDQFGWMALDDQRRQ
jgi:hypothetical protein